MRFPCLKGEGWGGGSHKLCARGYPLPALLRSADLPLKGEVKRAPGRVSYFTSEQPPSAIGRNACSAGMVETSL